MSHESNSLTPLEAALAALSPTPTQVDRDALMFAAGWSQASRRGWFWPTTAGCFALLSLSLGIRLVMLPTVSPTPTRSDVHDAAPREYETPSDFDSPGTRYGSLMRQTVERGELPALRRTESAAIYATEPLFQPTLERDLGFPAGSLRGFGPRFESSPNP